MRPLRFIFFPAFLILIFSSHTIFGQQRPNIIYIMADDMGYADLSCYGRKEYSTPNLDRMAASGMKFTNAYSAGSLCTPTRTAFMTGRYPARTPVGLREPLTTRKHDSLIGLSAGYPSVASLLKANGYKTALIGKWHLGYLPEFSPLSNGFDEFFGFKSGGIDYISHVAEGSRTHDLFENDEPVKREGYMTTLIMQKALEFINRAHNKPFFLSLQFSSPHWPWQGPADKAYPDTMNFTNGGSPEIYAEMMKSLDAAVGAVLDAVNKNKLAENTLIIFTSDNGGEKFSDMGEMSGRKFLLREGGIRVPAFVVWRGKINPGVTDQPVITMDWTATILALAKTKPATGFPLDGEDIFPILLGEAIDKDRTFYWRTFQRADQKAMRNGKWKYLKEGNEEFLFDIISDPSEKTNLKDNEKAVFDLLREKYRKWELEMLKPVPLGG